MMSTLEAAVKLTDWGPSSVRMRDQNSRHRTVCQQYTDLKASDVFMVSAPLSFTARSCTTTGL